MRRLLPAVLIVLAACGATASGQSSDKRLALPDGWQPEGIASAPDGSLYVGSIPTGAILRLEPGKAGTEQIVKPRQGRAAIGIEVDGDRILAAGGDTGKVFAYDRETGDPLRTYKLGGSDTFVNDIARLKGAFYVTDSRVSVIYKIPRDLGKATKIPVPDVSDDADFNLNGIEALDGRLYAVHSTDGDLYRIDPKTGDAVALDVGGKLTNGDGMLRGGGGLYVVRNQDNRIAQVAISDDLEAAKVFRSIKSTEFDVPTTVARIGSKLYAVNARFGTEDPESAEYWVTELKR